MTCKAPSFMSYLKNPSMAVLTSLLHNVSVSSEQGFQVGEESEVARCEIGWVGGMVQEINAVLGYEVHGGFAHVWPCIVLMQQPALANFFQPFLHKMSPKTWTEPPCSRWSWWCSLKILYKLKSFTPLSNLWSKQWRHFRRKIFTFLGMQPPFISYVHYIISEAVFGMKTASNRKNNTTFTP